MSSALHRRAVRAGPRRPGRSSRGSADRPRAVGDRVQLYGLYRPVGPPQPPWFPYADKLEHAVGFALPVLLVLLTVAWFAGGLSPAGDRSLVVVVFAVHAVVSELIQHASYRAAPATRSTCSPTGSGIAVGRADRSFARGRCTAAADSSDR